MRKMISWILTTVILMFFLIEYVIPNFIIAISYATYGIFNFEVFFTYWSIDGTVPALIFFCLCVFTYILFLMEHKRKYLIISLQVAFVTYLVFPMVFTSKTFVVFEGWVIYVLFFMSFAIFCYAIFQTVNETLEETLPRKKVVMEVYENLKSKYGLILEPFKQEVLAMLGRRDFEMIDALAKAIQSEQ